MSTLSITLPSNTFIKNGKHVTFKAPCSSKGVTGIFINSDTQVYKLIDSRKQELPEDIIVFEKDVMVHVILDVDNHLAYIQNASNSITTSGGSVSGVVDFKGRRGSVEPMTGDYTAEMVGAASITHAGQHAAGEIDAITPASIGAAAIDHDHGDTYAPFTHSHSNYSLSEHDHDGVYAAAAHTHEGVYAPYNHSHSGDGGIGFTQDEADKLYAAINHVHSLDDLGAASVEHTHTANAIGAADVNHTHTPADIGAASINHTHAVVDIGAAAANHTHDASEISGVALAEHKHTIDDIEGFVQETPSGDYLPLTGGELTGSLEMNDNNITGINELSFTNIAILEDHYTDDDENVIPIVILENTGSDTNSVIRGVASPVNGHDAANKSYVDTTVANAVAAAIAAIPVYDGTVS